MYNLFFWAYKSSYMCTFSKYSDSKVALEILKKKYPDAKIWTEKVQLIDSIEEWSDRFGNQISAYE